MTMRVKEAADYLKMSPHTLRLWCNKGKVPYERNLSGQRIFNTTDLDKFVREQKGLPEPQPTTVFYARSSGNNDVTIETQIGKLEIAYGEPEKTFKDKASGLSDKRPGIRSLLNYIKNNENKTTVYVTNKDRFTRFNFNYLVELVEAYGGNVVVLDSDDTKEPTEVLMADFMSLLASFSGKFYRLRGWEQQKRFLKDVNEEVEQNG